MIQLLTLERTTACSPTSIFSCIHWMHLVGRHGQFQRITNIKHSSNEKRRGKKWHSYDNSESKFRIKSSFYFRNVGVVEESQSQNESGITVQNRVTLAVASLRHSVAQNFIYMLLIPTLALNTRSRRVHEKLLNGHVEKSQTIRMINIDRGGQIYGKMRLQMTLLSKNEMNFCHFVLSIYKIVFGCCLMLSGFCCKHRLALSSLMIRERKIVNLKCGQRLDFVILQSNKQTEPRFHGLRYIYHLHSFRESLFALSLRECV